MTVRHEPVAQSIDEERQFDHSEIFFSTTDEKGIIRAGNRVFTRISAYSRAELLGSPHNIIRHPAMPRSVFKLLWDTIDAGLPIAAYVKNRAKDGRYYWVLATVMPCAGGYLSVRIKPSTALFDAARGLYPLMLAREQEVEGDDPHRRKQAMEASAALLMEKLLEAGFSSYEQFMRAALLAEVQKRAAMMRTLPPLPPPSSTASATLNDVWRASTAISAFLGRLIANFDAYTTLNEQLTAKAAFVLDLSDDVGLFALNALVASTRVRDQSTTIGTVASLMQTQSTASSTVFQELTTDVMAAVDLIASMSFPVSVARLQAEVLQVFVRELSTEDGQGAVATADDLGALAQCVASGVESLADSLHSLSGKLQGLTGHIERLTRSMGVLRALEMQGRIEASRSSESDGVLTLFHTIAGRLEQARNELQEIGHLAAFSFQNDIAEARACRQHAQRIRQDVSTLHEVPTPRRPPRAAHVA